MSPREERELARRATLGRIDRAQRRLYAAESALALRAVTYNDVPIWRFAELAPARERFLHAAAKAREFRRSLMADLAVLAARGGAGLAREIRREVRREVVLARAGARPRPVAGKEVAA